MNERSHGPKNRFSVPKNASERWAKDRLTEEPRHSHLVDLTRRQPKGRLTNQQWPFIWLSVECRRHEQASSSLSSVTGEVSLIVALGTQKWASSTNQETGAIFLGAKETDFRGFKVKVKQPRAILHVPFHSQQSTMCLSMVSNQQKLLETSPFRQQLDVTMAGGPGLESGSNILLVILVWQACIQDTNSDLKLACLTFWKTCVTLKKTCVSLKKFE